MSALAACTLLALGAPTAAQESRDARIDLRVDASEAEAVLAILDLVAARRPVDDAAWRRLFETEPYRRLQRREAEMQRAFTDEAFRAFVLAPELRARAPELRATLAAWTKADLRGAAEAVFAYLPAQARIRARVFPVIKPHTNSFVFEVRSDPAIFLYLDPAMPAAEFANTVAHELHHIGFASLADESDAAAKALAPAAREASVWLGAFGEGFAMLAAAGGADVHPHAASAAKDRERWDRDVANFPRDVKTLDRFFQEAVSGRMPGAEMSRRAGEFYGEQGPWYTVGWKMAVIVEKRFGRAVLIECMRDPRKILARYNAAAREANARSGERETMALWSPEVLKAFAVD